MDDDPSIRVLIAATDPLARAGLAAVLAEEPGVRVAGRCGASDPAEIVAATDLALPDTLIFDLGWSADAAIACLSELAPTAPPILALAPDATAALAALRAGARGILPREAPARDILAALAALTHGLHVLHPDFVPDLLPPSSSTSRNLLGPPDLRLGPSADPSRDSPRPPLPLEPLTPRELDVLRLLSEGLTNKAIAHQLGISPNTVKLHVHTILAKLGAASRTEATRTAARHGLIWL